MHRGVGCVLCAVKGGSQDTTITLDHKNNTYRLPGSLHDRTHPATSTEQPAPSTQGRRQHADEEDEEQKRVRRRQREDGKEARDCSNITIIKYQSHTTAAAAGHGYMHWGLECID